MNVGWYEHGYALHEPGNLVLYRHLSASESGGPGGLWSIDTLQQGDALFVAAADKTSVQYIVQHVTIHGAGAEISPEDVADWYGPSDGRRLTIIAEDHGAHGSDRRVVVVGVGKSDT